MSIHSRIRESRLAKGLTSHKALADQVGVVWQTVQQWEKEGGTAPNRKRIGRVAKVLGVTVEWLTTGESEKEQKLPKKSGAVKLNSLVKNEVEVDYLVSLVSIYGKLNNNGRSRLLDAAREIENIASCRREDAS